MNDDEDAAQVSTAAEAENTTEHTQQLQIIDSSTCNELFDQLLATYYTPLEVWYIRSAIDKVSLDISSICIRVLMKTTGTSSINTRPYDDATNDYPSRRHILHT
jgi:hypothetical protein